MSIQHVTDSANMIIKPAQVSETGEVRSVTFSIEIEIDDNKTVGNSVLHVIDDYCEKLRQKHAIGHLPGLYTPVVAWYSEAVHKEQSEKETT